jgi:hypothetical protein
MGTTTLPPYSLFIPPFFEPSSVTKHRDLHEKPAGLRAPSACFIICQFGFFLPFIVVGGNEARKCQPLSYHINEKILSHC